MNSLFTLLPTKMISKHYINGLKIDYEKYLIELLNESNYFMSLTNGEKFRKKISQSNGEPDAITNSYEIELKLLNNSEFTNKKLKSLPNVDYSNIKNGFICLDDKVAVENNMTQAQANSLFIRFLQSLALTKKSEISTFENNKQNPLYSAVKGVKKEKNLLMFPPCVINTNGSNMTRISTTFFSSLFALRDNMNKDTFVALLCQDDYFYILKYEHGTFKIIDKIHKIFVTSFNSIYRMTYFLEDK